MRIAPTARLATAVFVAAIVATACSGGSSRTRPSLASAPITEVTGAVSASGTGLATTTATPHMSNDAAVTEALASYLAMWGDMVEAAKTANYSSPRLANHAMSQALQLLYGGLMSAHDDGVVILGKPLFAPMITETKPASDPVAVSLVDCMDGSDWLEYSAKTGKRRDGNPGGKHHATATVGKYLGVWKVATLKVDGPGTCG